MSKSQKKTQEHKYLVCAVYGDQNYEGGITKIKHIGIVQARSSFDAVVTVRRDHNPGEVKPRKYIASRILGDFKTNAFSDRTYTCEELLS